MLYKTYKKQNIKIFLSILVLIGAIFLGLNDYVQADELEILNKQIEEKRVRLQQIESEITEQRKLIQQTSGQANTLQSKIKSLEANRRQIESEISKTQNQIQKAELTIEKLSYEIVDKNRLAEITAVAMIETIKSHDKLIQKSLVERILGYQNMSDFWTDLENNTKIQEKLFSEINILLEISEELRDKESNKLAERSALAKFQEVLSGERQAVDLTRSEQQTLLQRTKNQESEYQKILEQKLAEKRAFEQEVLEIESQIKVLIDPTSFPDPQRGILSWPVENIRITQLFGGTQFAATNPGIYGRPFHNGVDFGVPIGTKVKSISEGSVWATGNTDAFPGCNAWGRWLLIRHDNGLTSLSAHLSSVLVSPGQRVAKGEIVALSGNTGVSTGPHLHLTLYITQGVQVGKYNSYRSGGGCSATEATGPFADLNAYLDPMNYLPQR